VVFLNFSKQNRFGHILVTNVTNGQNSKVTGTNLFLFLFQLKWFGMNEIRQNIPESEICSCFLFGIRIETGSRLIFGPVDSVEVFDILRFGATDLNLQLFLLQNCIFSGASLSDFFFERIKNPAHF